VHRIPCLDGRRIRDRFRESTGSGRGRNDGYEAAGEEERETVYGKGVCGEVGGEYGCACYSAEGVTAQEVM
jgi:hypothetical protein